LESRRGCPRSMQKPSTYTELQEKQSPESRAPSPCSALVVEQCAFREVISTLIWLTYQLSHCV
jgi:hypothetical protein